MYCNMQKNKIKHAGIRMRVVSFKKTTLSSLHYIYMYMVYAMSENGK